MALLKKVSKRGDHNRQSGARTVYQTISIHSIFKFNQLYASVLGSLF